MNITTNGEYQLQQKNMIENRLEDNYSGREIVTFVAEQNNELMNVVRKEKSVSENKHGSDCSRCGKL